MKAIRIKTFQASACFRLPTRTARYMTYPLPPASTVAGMVHAMCGWTEYHPFQVSIGGTFASAIEKDLQTMIRGFGVTDSVNGENPEFEKRWTHKFNDGGRRYGFVKVPTTIDFVSDLSLILHIVPDLDSDLEEIYLNLKNPPIYPSLGRNDDLLDIEEVKLVDLLADELVTTEYQYWIQPGMLYKAVMPYNSSEKDITGGSTFRFAKKYKKIKRRRVWEDKQDFFLTFTDISVKTLIDSDRNPVFLI